MTTRVEEVVHRAQLEAEFQQQLMAVGPAFEVTLYEARPKRPSTFEEAQREAESLKAEFLRAMTLPYRVGDWVRATEANLGEAASQIIDVDFLPEQFINSARVVTDRVSPKLRALAPTFDHARAVAHLKPEQQERFIQKALDENWIASKLKSEVQTAQVGGESKMRFLLIVDCGGETKQTTLADRLEKDGFTVTKRSGIKKEAKPKKAKRAKKGEVTARGKKRGVVKPYARRRKS